MATIETLFATRLYSATLPRAMARRINADLEAQSLSIAGDDGAGQRWSQAHDYAGYTSYASLNDLAWRAPAFADLQQELDRHAARFAAELAFDLGGRKLRLNSLWINILEPGGWHSSHIHTHSVLSGTYYVRVPAGASALRFEDPRLGFMMAAPARRVRAPRELQSFVPVKPKAGTLLLWESWLRHEVMRNAADSERISISFNYGLA